MQNPVCQSPISGENTKLDKNVKRTIFTSETGSCGKVGERTNPKMSIQTRAISEQLLSCRKKNGGNRPVINLKNFNKFIAYEHFRMEGLHCLKLPLKQDDFLCKIDLKEGYFSVPLNKNSQNFVRFQWSGNMYEFFCLCFGIRPAPRTFTKLLKVPIDLLRWVKIQIMIYLDDMLLMGRT